MCPQNITYWQLEKNSNGCPYWHRGVSGEPTEWEEYVERLKNYFVTHDRMTEAKKRTVLLSTCGAGGNFKVD